MFIRSSYFFSIVVPTWMRRMGLCAGVLALSVFSGVPAAATVISGTVVGASPPPVGNFIKISVPLRNPYGPPNSVGQNTFELPNLYAFDEDQNILIKRALAADVGKSPVPAGKVVASHYVFFDPGGGTEIFGVVNFDAPIVAIMTSTGTLAASDFLANTGVTYLNPGARGLEPGDFVTISDKNQITFHTVASNPGDYVRVLTEFSPRAITLRMFFDSAESGMFGRNPVFNLLFSRNFSP
jgi:hypothetical protein